MTMHRCDCGQLLWLVSDVKCHDCGTIHLIDTAGVTNSILPEVNNTKNPIPSGQNGLQGLLNGLLPLAINFQ